MGNKPRILIMDIENTPNTAYIWGLFQEITSAEMIDCPWHMLCWSAKWLGEKEVYSSALIDFPKEYKKDPENDKLILKELWKLLDEADVVIGHNMKGFDSRKANARFIMNDMPPPSPYKIVDTLLAARQYFFFTSNKLNDLSKYLSLGAKVDTGGFKLWKQCMAGNKEAWNKMVNYCKHDVLLTEKVYLKLRPYMTNHPNLNVYSNTDDCQCNKCGSKNIKKEGFSYTAAGKYQQYSCKDCKGWFRGKKNLNNAK